MKNYLTLSFLLISLLASSQSFFESTDQFLSKYVENGEVDYAAIKSEPASLNALVKEIAEHNLSNKRVTEDYMKAFYINAYNILVIKQVVDRYPVYGPLKVDGFFDKIKNEVMGEQLTLNELEKETLYKKFPDARLHFVLVCAAKGCPPLASYGFNPDNLNKALDKRTSYVLNLDWFIDVKKKNVAVSQIFSWYQSDFEKEANSIVEFINTYRTDKIETKKVTNYEYDWSLNDKN